MDDQICLTFPDLYRGQDTCDLYFVDRENSTPENPRYIVLNSFGIRIVLTICSVSATTITFVDVLLNPISLHFDFLCSGKLEGSIESFLAFGSRAMLEWVAAGAISYWILFSIVEEEV